MDALIGDTGFVGGHLNRQHEFVGRFNSRTIQDAEGQAFGAVVCAAAPGSMFEANKFPDRDRGKIDELCQRVAAIKADQFILISSIAVFADFAGGDDEGSSAFQEELAYGRHRRALEAFCADHFARCLIVRLPALYGRGLRKNFIFDLLNPVPTMLTAEKIDGLKATLPDELSALVDAIYRHDPAVNMFKVDRAALDASPRRNALGEAVTEAGFAAVQFHNPDTTYQYYDMERLWADIDVALAADLDVIHLAMAPSRASDIHAALTGRPMPDTGARLHREDMRTRHAELWQRSGPYLQSADEVLAGLKQFFARERAQP